MHEFEHVEQERCGSWNFRNVRCAMTRGFSIMFSNPYMIIEMALRSIIDRYGTKADYLQVFYYSDVETSRTKFWAIHDGERVTFLLPDEY